MGDYISREAAIRLANNHVDGRIDANDIARLHSADVREAVRGEWERYRECCLEVKCSKCGAGHCREDNFCPNCGADMKK